MFSERIAKFPFSWKTPCLSFEMVHPDCGKLLAERTEEFGSGCWAVGFPVSSFFKGFANIKEGSYGTAKVTSASRESMERG